MEKMTEFQFERVSIHPDGQILAMSSKDKLQIVDLKSNKIIKGEVAVARVLISLVFENKKGVCHLLNNSVLFSPNGYEMLIPVAIEKGCCEIRKLDLRKMEIVQKIGLDFIPQEICFDFKGKHFFVNDGILTIYKTKSKSEVVLIFSHEQALSS